MPRTRPAQTPGNVGASTAQPPRAPAAPTGLPQGERKALVDSQSAVPTEDATGRIQAAIQAAMAGGQAPLGDGGAMMQPTNAPLQPVQAGLPMGPGGGPEVVPPPAVPTTVDDFQMAHYLPMLETLADLPGTSDATRQYVRRMRGSVPPAVTMQSIVKPAP